MSKNRVKVAVEAARVTSREEAERVVGEIAATTNQQVKMSAEMDREILLARQRYQGTLDAIAAELQAKTEALKAWAEGNPAEFPKGRKSIEFVQGVIGFRTGTPKLAPLNRSWTWEKILSAIRVRLPGFVRVKEEVDREGILSQREDGVVGGALEGVGLRVVQEETFFVEPKLTEVETRQAVS